MMNKKPLLVKKKSLIDGKCEAVIENIRKCVCVRKMFIEKISKDMLKMFITCNQTFYSNCLYILKMGRVIKWTINSKI
ncbi:hypothetical protein AY606_09570 [Acinetobacter sp. SFB]|nr:hypothetical protein AY606_09570 [Acinetobacter sp. SFB]